MESMFSSCSARSRVLMAGAACVVFSRLTPEEIKLLLTYRPEALSLKDPDSGETVFTMTLDDEKPGSLMPECAVFSCIPSADGKATITILVDPSCRERRELVEEKLGVALKHLDELETCLLEILPEVRKDQDMIRSWIDEL